MGPPCVAAPTVALLKAPVFVAFEGVVLVHDVTMAVLGRVARESAGNLTVVQRLSVVAIEEDLPELGGLLKNLECRADVRSFREKVPVVLKVDEPRRIHGFANEVEA